MAKSNPPPPPPASPRDPDLEQDVEDRDAILARRAIFITSALAGLSMAISCDPRPQPCLSPPMQQPAESAPQPCLSVSLPIDPPDAGAVIETDAGPDPRDAGGVRDAGSVRDAGGVRDAGPGDAGPPQDAGTPDPRPHPCLRVAPPPQPCLKVAPPRDRE